MATSQLFTQSSITIDSATRTPIPIPRLCTRISLKNEDTTNDCTIFDRDSGGTGVTLSAGTAIDISWPYHVGTADAVLCWVTAIAGTGPITLRTI